MVQQLLTPLVPVQRRSRAGLFVVLTAVVVVVAGGMAVLFSFRDTGERAVTSATLKLADGRIVGLVDFFDAHPGTVVRARVQLPDGTPGAGTFHGFHLHANDDAINGNGCMARPDRAPKTWFVSADAHLDRGEHAHGAHSGDLPSLYVAPDGRGELEFRTDRVSAADLVGRAVVLHAGPDNFGRVPTGTAAQEYTANSTRAAAATRQGGNSGDRIACGLVGTPAAE